MQRTSIPICSEQQSNTKRDHITRTREAGSYQSTNSRHRGGPIWWLTTDHKMNHVIMTKFQIT